MRTVLTAKQYAIIAGLLVVSCLAAIQVRLTTRHHVQRLSEMPEYSYMPTAAVHRSALFAMPTTGGRWYVFTWEERVTVVPPADTRYIFDREDMRPVAIGVYRGTPTNFARRTAVFYAQSSQRHIRCLASAQGELNVCRLGLRVCPAWLGMAWRYWHIPLWCGLIGICWQFRRRLLAAGTFCTAWYRQAPNGARWCAALGLTGVLYMLAGIPVVGCMLRNNGWDNVSKVIWHVAGVPPGILCILYACGWPIIVWALQGRRRPQVELLLSIGAGLAVLMCTFSFSVAGIRSHVIAAGVLLYVLCTWSMLIDRGIRPVAPDTPALVMMCAALAGLWIMLAPLRTERDVWPSTMHNADISVYVTETIAYYRWSAREVNAMAFANQEPTFLAYKADTLRRNPFNITYSRVSDATEHATAVLAWMLNTAPEHVLGAYAGLLLSVLSISLTGALRMWMPVRCMTALVTAVTFHTCFPLIYLQRDAYYNNMHGLIFMLFVVLLVTRALITGAWRLGVIAGLAMAALNMSFLIILPLVVVVLGAYISLRMLLLLYTRSWGMLTHSMAVLAVFVLTSVMAAPQLVWCAVQDAVGGKIGASMFVGRPRYPERSWVLLGGFVADWLTYHHAMIVRCIHVLSMAATLAGTAALLIWLCLRPARGIRAIAGVTLIVAGGMIVWMYRSDPSRYAYFKNLIIGATVFSFCASAAWATLPRHTRGVARLVTLLLCSWLAVRVISWPFGLVASKSVRVMNEKIATVRQLTTLLPHEACLLVDSRDYYYTPLLHAYLYGMKLRSNGVVGYASTAYPGDDYTHILKTAQDRSMPALWNNGYYWLYAVTRGNSAAHNP